MPQPDAEMTVQDLLDTYLKLGVDGLCQRHIDQREYDFRLFGEMFGSKKLSECKAIDMLHFLKAHPEWASEYTRRRTVSGIKRAFNFCLEMELIDRNPYARFRSKDSLPIRRTPMADDDFQTVMRFSPPAWRRFLVALKFSGARPGELASMRWRDVHLEEGCILLHSHKTAKKVGRPRIIPLVPTTIKLLLWMRARRQTTAAWLLVRLLKRGPVKAREVARFLSHYGISDRSGYRARQSLGIIKRWVGPPDVGPHAALAGLAARINTAHEACKGKFGPGHKPALDSEKVCEVGSLLLEAQALVPRRRFSEWIAENCSMSQRSAEERMEVAKRAGLTVARMPEVHTGKEGCYVYELPPEYDEPPQPSDDDHVFLTCLGTPLNRSNWGLYMRRVRDRAGIEHVCTLYQLRHRWFTNGIKNNVNLKLLSLAGGHASTVMTEHYLHEAGLTDEVKAAALQICYGAGAYAVQAPPIPKPIPTVSPPPIETIPRATEHLPTPYREGGPRRPHIHAQLADVPMPNPGMGVAEQSLEQMMRHMMGQVSAQKRTWRPKPTTSTQTVSPTHEAAYNALEWAKKQNPELAKAKDTPIYKWLRTRTDCPFAVPALLSTFQRYLTAARKYHGTRKRIMPDRPPAA